jgi:hypothetical protein
MMMYRKLISTGLPAGAIMPILYVGHKLITGVRRLRANDP